MDARIQMQKAVVQANRLPNVSQPLKRDDFRDSLLNRLCCCQRSRVQKRHRSH